MQKKREGCVTSVSLRPRKRKVTSQKEAIFRLAASFDNLKKSQEKRMEMWADAEHKREEAFLKYQERQDDLNRQHELRLMEIMVRSQNPTTQQQQQQYPQAYSQQYSQYPGAIFSTGFHEVSSQEPHITNLDSYNRQGSFP